MNRFVIVVAIILGGFFGIHTVAAQTAPDVCHVKGTIAGLDSKTTLYVLKRTGEFTSDTIATTGFNDQGAFAFSVPVADNQELLDIRFSTLRGSVPFVSEPGQVFVKGDKRNIYGMEVGGTVENDRWNRYMSQILIWTKDRNAINMNSDMPKEEKGARLKQFDLLQKQYVDSLVENFPNSVVALYLAKIPLPMLDHETIAKLLTQFKPYFAKHRYYQEMEERYHILRKVSVGMIAPDFTAVQADGQTPITLSDFRGKYVLLDFWASWCVPCRAENKGTKKLYEKYHPLGLEFISFSLDADIKAWNKAIQADGLVWHNASDLKMGKLSPVAQKYGIDGIPAIWIIDPEGKVVGANIRGEALDKLLSEIFIK